MPYKINMDKNDIIENKLLLLDEIASQIDRCTDCDLYKRKNKTVPGSFTLDSLSDDKPKILFLGEAPGALEDSVGECFVGRSGHMLEYLIKEFLYLDRHQVSICNVIKCRPPDNRRPSEDEVILCLAYLYKQIGIIQPDLIVALGSTAMHSILFDAKTKFTIDGYISGMTVTSNRNKIHTISLPKMYKVEPWSGNAIITYHPSVMLRNKKLFALGKEDFKFINRYLNSCMEKKNIEHSR